MQESGGKIQVKNCFFAYCSFLKQYCWQQQEEQEGAYFYIGPKLQAVSFGLDELPVDIVDDNETIEE